MALSAAGCASPAGRVNREAARLGLSRDVVQGTEFLHVTYHNNVHLPGGVLHVYLEGDGSPWLDGGHRVSPDPTPRDPLMLRLMAGDENPSVYLGRPCYYGLAAMPPCNPMLWTHERYSQRVVDSMVAALRRILAREGRARFVLLGHSGGGTLAMLMAEQQPSPRAVVTVAGNLDVAAWAHLHGYTPLRGSLDPARRPPLPASVAQLHLTGGHDEDVPPWITQPVIARQPGAQVLAFEEFDHRCCWEKVWRTVLARIGRWNLEAKLGDAMPLAARQPGRVPLASRPAQSGERSGIDR